MKPENSWHKQTVTWLSIVGLLGLAVGFGLGYGYRMVHIDSKTRYKTVSAIKLQAGVGQNGVLPVGSILILDRALPEIMRFKTYINLSGVDGLQEISPTRRFEGSPLDGFLAK
jgi:hypothetical protein